MSKEEKKLHKEIFSSVDDKKSQVSTDCFGNTEICYQENFDDLGIDLAKNNLDFPCAETGKNLCFDFDIFGDVTNNHSTKYIEKEEQIEELFPLYHYRSFSMHENGLTELDDTNTDNFSKISYTRPVSLSFNYY